MRGKIVLLCVFITLLSVSMVSIAFSQDEVYTIMRVDPKVSAANPGEKFWVSVTIENVTDLWAFGFKLGYKSGTKVLGALSAEAGDFLTVYGTGTFYFTYQVDVVHGYINVGCTLTDALLPGVTGSGTLAEIEFVVAEAGDSPLHIYDVKLLDSSLNYIATQTRDGSFDGSNVELVRVNLGSRVKRVGQMQTFDIKVVNEGTVPLNVRARTDNVRLEDGLTTTLWAGQSYVFPPVREPEYLYVDGFDATSEEWTAYGASPYLDAPDDGNYIEGTFDGAWHRWFTFEDIALEGAVVDYVQLEGYCDGPYDEAVDYDIFDGDTNWFGSLYATGAGPEWVTPRWVGPLRTSDILPYLLDEDGINNFVVALNFFDPEGHGGAGRIVDSLRLYVVFKAGRAPEYPAVDGFDATSEEWTAYGASPYLDAPDDGNYIEGTFDGAWHRWFTFEDISVGTDVIDYVDLWGYCDGPYDEAVDYDIFDGDTNWFGSLYATGAGPEWVTPRWIGSLHTSDILPYLLDEDGINNFVVALNFFDPEGHGGAGRIVDALKLEVTFKAERVVLPRDPPTVVVQPGEVVELDFAVWGLEPEDVGTYACTITVYYSFYGKFFNAGEKKVVTRSWSVK